MRAKFFLDRIFREALLDGSKGSFGRMSALPFLVSAWFIGTFQGIRMVLADKDALDVVWALALIATLLYGGSKGLSAAKAIANRKDAKAPELGGVE